MSPSERHQHIERPSEEQRSIILSSKPPVIRQLYLDVHRLVLDTLPGVAHSTDSVDGGTGYGARQYGYDGWGLAGLSAHTRWVSLHFMRGADLDDNEQHPVRRGDVLRGTYAGCF